jgi:DNA repair protein RecN (Recombination protein N)
VLIELAVRDLGVIADLQLVLGEGMTALTGETGAGKTLVVEALELLVGGRAEGSLVRSGAGEAWVEGRFELDGEELVVARVVPADGRSRAFVNGHLVPIQELAALGARLVDLHGQHAHQSLLHPATQRAALDSFGRIDRRPLEVVRARLRRIEESLGAVGGDERARAREIELLRFQVGELDRAGLDDPDEDEALAWLEEALSSASAHREAAWEAVAALLGTASSEHAGVGGLGAGRSSGPPAGVAEALATALAAVSRRPPLAEAEERLRALWAEASELAMDLRRQAEAMEDDPGRLEEVRARRQQLAELKRKYGPTLEEVMSYGEDARRRLVELESHGERVRALEAERRQAGAEAAAEEQALGDARRAAAPGFADAVEARLRRLAMPHARFSVELGGSATAEPVSFVLCPNPGEAPLPLSRAASGGELARAMLALRLVLTEGPPTLVFDEVDAGVGGEAALAVGKALAEVARSRQVLVVTHLPQVAAFADHQVAVRKRTGGGRTVADARSLGEAERAEELSRMLSGRPSSARARDHATELLAEAEGERRRVRLEGGRSEGTRAPTRVRKVHQPARRSG